MRHVIGGHPTAELRGTRTGMRIVKAGVLYFAVVFGAGFVLGPIRILWVVPRLGTRVAELLEAPIMFVITIVAARWIVRKLAVAPMSSSRLGMGCIALSLMLIAEFTLVLWLRGLSISEYLAGRDPVAGTVYYLMLGLFAVMPLLVLRRQRSPQNVAARPL
jgi:hypothetical protein